MVTVEMKTNKGMIVLELDSEKSPATVENFLKYVEDGYFDGLIFHRVIDGFMIQGGGFESGMKEKSTLYPPIENEARKSWLENKRGTIAMARTNDPDSATSQFFINLADNTFLNPGENDLHGYVVFGKVTSGMDVVDIIAKVKTHSAGMHQDVPIEDVVIESVEVKE
ncbi:MAG: peptidyl-prolyl cis-trans isomerase [Candidatus Aenigmarchaeota archaeon]|nr:peptidyl-prolyl cis-trans isomerase [Candidatus Aenigmarchaeota archaeon]